MISWRSSSAVRARLTSMSVTSRSSSDWTSLVAARLIWLSATDHSRQWPRKASSNHSATTLDHTSCHQTLVQTAAGLHLYSNVGSGTGTRTLNLAVNRSLHPVQKRRSEIA